MDDVKNLVNKAKAGDRGAFGQIYKLYFAKIYRYCEFNLNDKDEAQDICQETFVKAWRSIKKFDTKRANWSIQAFLFTIARNLIIDRSRKKKELHLDGYLELTSGEDIYEGFERKNNVDIVKKAISRLEESERQIIILRYFEDMDTKEIANILGINDGAVRVRLHRTMEKLRKIVESLHGERN